ncbi:MAG: PqqD family protein [Chitinispirillales bacterium]|jgi:SMC interacting uncharacterized protein involved in chromosome segregation|nr:PqqD family protein [Chitinispirillales bacterium]
MKLNGIEVNIQQVNMEQVDGVFIIHDSVSKKVIQLNETSSFVWKMILEHERISDDLDLVTSHIVSKVLEVYEVPEDEKRDVFSDVEKILKDFLDTGLLLVKSMEKSCLKLEKGGGIEWRLNF